MGQGWLPHGKPSPPITSQEGFHLQPITASQWNSMDYVNWAAGGHLSLRFDLTLLQPKSKCQPNFTRLTTGGRLIGWGGNSNPSDAISIGHASTPVRYLPCRAPESARIHSKHGVSISDFIEIRSQAPCHVPHPSGPERNPPRLT